MEGKWAFQKASNGQPGDESGGEAIGAGSAPKISRLKKTDHKNPQPLSLG